MIFKSVAIVGLGLIGGSLASALKKFGVAKEVLGLDVSRDVVDYALSKGVIDKGFLSLDKAEIDSEFVVIATHVDKIAEAVKDILPYLNEGTVITDVGSVKSVIVHQVEGIIVKKVYFVGSHPIAGTENSGVKFSDPNLFKDRKVVITPSSNTNTSALEKVKELWESVGGNVVELDPETHDLIFAYVSHLPHAVAYSLINSVGKVEQIENIFDYSGGGLKDYTRVAASSPEMWRSIFLQNKDSVLNAIDSLKISIQELEDAIRSDDESKLINLLRTAQGLKKSDTN